MRRLILRMPSEPAQRRLVDFFLDSSLKAILIRVSGCRAACGHHSPVKFPLTAHQTVCLLCKGGRFNVPVVRSNRRPENAMTHTLVNFRLVEGLLAVVATAAFVLIVQFAMVVS